MPFHAERIGMKFWHVFQAENSGKFFPCQNFKPKVIFQAKITRRNSVPKFHAKMLTCRDFTPKCRAKIVVVLGVLKFICWSGFHGIISFQREISWFSCCWGWHMLSRKMTSTGPPCLPPFTLRAQITAKLPKSMGLLICVVHWIFFCV